MLTQLLPLALMFTALSTVAAPKEFAAPLPDYSPQAGHGWLPSDRSPPQLFAATLPEGTYRLTITLASGQPSATTIRTQCRQLQFESVLTAPGQPSTLITTINIRTPTIPGSDKPVSLKRAPERNYDESENPRWHDRLLLEVNSTAPNSPLQSLTIEPAPDLPVIYLIGDSTVCDQPGEPYSSWGQVLPRWIKPTATVANHAESGESYASFLGERRWDKILTTLKPGDFVLMQMGHNDQKIKEDNYARTGYVANITRIINEARARGATPILITPPERQRFKDGLPQDSLGDFPQAVRDTAKALNVPLIDLTPATKTLYAHFGPPPASNVLFAPKDATHHNNFGSYLISQIIANHIRDHVPSLASHLRNDLPSINPAAPMSPNDYTLPPSPSLATTRPAGS